VRDKPSWYAMSGRAQNTQLDLGSSACLAPDVEGRVYGGPIILTRDIQITDWLKRLAAWLYSAKWFCPRSLAPTGAAEESQDRLAIQRDCDLFAIASGLASSIDWNYYPPHEVRRCLLRPNPAAKWTQTSFTQNRPKTASPVEERPSQLIRLGGIGISSHLVSHPPVASPLFIRSAVPREQGQYGRR
jgi:hypothetical protein